MLLNHTYTQQYEDDSVIPSNLRSVTSNTSILQLKPLYFYVILRWPWCGGLCRLALCMHLHEQWSNYEALAVGDWLEAVFHRILQGSPINVWCWYVYLTGVLRYSVVRPSCHVLQNMRLKITPVKRAKINKSHWSHITSVILPEIAQWWSWCGFMVYTFSL